MSQEKNRSFDFVVLSNVNPEPICWLWTKRIPLKKLSLVEGDPGDGKSTLLADLAARVSVGSPMPNGSPGIQGGVVYISSEDSLNDTLKPRLSAAGADLSKIVCLTSVRDDKDNRRIPTIKDIDDIRQLCIDVQAKLLIIDPISAHAGRTNLNSDQAVRRVMAPLAKMAEELGLAAVLVRHLNKTAKGKSKYRGGGSIAVIGIVRSAYLIARHPEDERLRVFASNKSNIAREDERSLVFEIIDSGTSSRIVWRGDSDYTADSLLSAKISLEEKIAIDEAKAFLIELLSPGPMEFSDLYKEARKAGIKRAALFSAKTVLGIELSRSDEGTWQWSLKATSALKP